MNDKDFRLKLGIFMPSYLSSGLSVSTKEKFKTVCKVHFRISVYQPSGHAQQETETERR